MKSQCRQCVRIGGRRGQCGQRAAVQFDAVEVRDLRPGCPAGKLVTKPDQVSVGDQHPGAQAFVQCRPGFGTHPFQQGDIGARTAYRDRVRDVAGLGRQPGQSTADRLGNAARQRLPGQRVRPCGQYLGDEKRIAAADLMQLFGVYPATGSQRRPPPVNSTPSTQFDSPWRSSPDPPGSPPTDGSAPARRRGTRSPAATAAH